MKVCEHKGMCERIKVQNMMQKQLRMIKSSQPLVSAVSCSLNSLKKYLVLNKNRNTTLALISNDLKTKHEVNDL